MGWPRSIKKPAISPKRCKVWPRLLWRTNSQAGAFWSMAWNTGQWHKTMTTEDDDKNNTNNSSALLLVGEENTKRSVSLYLSKDTIKLLQDSGWGIMKRRSANLYYILHYDRRASLWYRFFMKLLRTNNIETVEVCQFYFGVSLPSVVLRNTSERFEQKFRLHSELLKAPV